MIKWALRITVFGVIMHVIAPGALADTIIQASDALGLILTGTIGMLSDRAIAGGKHFILDGGWLHPTEGAIGWDILSMIRSLF